MSNEINGYTLSRDWFDFCFENPEKIKPRHTALYFFAIEHCNRLGWKKKYGLPTTMAMEAIGISSYNTYKKTFDDLVEWGFINLIQKSENQYSSNKIALSKFDKPLDKSLDKALSKHASKQGESTDSIDKQTNKGTKEQGNSTPPPDSDGVEVPTIEEFKKYGNQIGIVPDYCEHVYESSLSRGWRNGHDNLIRDWRAYLRMKFKYQHKWIDEQRQEDDSGLFDNHPLRRMPISEEAGLN